MSVVLATAGYDHKIRFWEAPSGKCTRLIKFSDSQVNRLEITPDKQFIAAAGNPLIRVYEIDSSSSSSTGTGTGNNPSHHQQSQQAALTIEGHTAAVTSIGFQKEGRYLYSGSEDGTVKVWDLRSAKYCRSFDCHAAVNAVTLRTDRDEFISGDAQGMVRIWDFGGHGCINAVQPLSAGGSSGAYHHHHHMPTTTAAAAATTTTSSTTSSSTAATIPAETGTVPIQAVDISEDSRTLVAISNHGTVFVWDPVSNSSSSTMDNSNNNNNNNHNDPLGSNNTSTDGNNNNSNNNSWLRPITKFRATLPGYYCLHGKIAPDCRHLVTTGSDGMAKLWDTTTWELTNTLPTTTTTTTTTSNAPTTTKKWVWDAAFCADSSYLVTASSDAIARLWNLRTAEVVRQYRGHPSAVTCVALNDSNA